MSAMRCPKCGEQWAKPTGDGCGECLIQGVSVELVPMRRAVRAPVNPDIADTPAHSLDNRNRKHQGHPEGQ